MKVLIIEDTEYKISGLEAVLATCDFVDEVSVAKSFQSGIHGLKQFRPDLVLLDMTLPTSQLESGEPDGRWRLYGGKEIVAEMKFCNISGKVIFITQFDYFGEHPNKVESKILIAALKKQFPGIVLGGVYYSNTDSRWASRLRVMLEDVSRAR